LLPNPTNRLGVYVAYGDCHTTSLRPDWQNHTMTKGTTTISAEQALTAWLNGTTDQAWIQDTGPDNLNVGTWTATYRITNTAYSGWVTNWRTCGP
jgi:hypothetical protein